MASEPCDLRKVVGFLARVDGEYLDAHDLIERKGHDKRADFVVFVDRFTFEDQVRLAFDVGEFPDFIAESVSKVDQRADVELRPKP